MYERFSDWKLNENDVYRLWFWESMWAIQTLQSLASLGSIYRNWFITLIWNSNTCFNDVTSSIEQSPSQRKRASKCNWKRNERKVKCDAYKRISLEKSIENERVRFVRKLIVICIKVNVRDESVTNICYCCVYRLNISSENINKNICRIDRLFFFSINAIDWMEHKSEQINLFNANN